VVSISTVTPSQGSLSCRLANSARAPSHHFSNGAILTLTSISLRDWREAITQLSTAQGAPLLSFRSVRRNDLSSRDEPKPPTLFQFVKGIDAPWPWKLCLAAFFYFLKIFGMLEVMKPVTEKKLPEPPE
jgi:hypothetical protein